ncbi:hypothetical protein [Gaetbulibacter saemankumensis]|uniref:hypothetical protein n=1 Tax=Gaetbulibacter saemankumensis TaxID=311208 RepID=UPI0004195943|nr:hypothetical protein [Gaetbulibacter saemankumensis]
MENNQIEDNIKQTKKILLLNEVSAKKKLTREDIIEITKLEAEGVIKKEEIYNIGKVFPEFFKMQITLINALINVSYNFNESHKKSVEPLMEVIRESANILEKLTEKVESDESIKIIAEKSIELAKIHIEILKINERMSKDKNSVYKRLISNLVFATVVGGIFFFKRVGKLG